MTDAIRPVTNPRMKCLTISVAGLMLLLAGGMPALAYQDVVPVRRPFYVAPVPDFPTDRPALPPPRVRVTVEPENLETLTGEVVSTAPNRITFSNNDIYEQSFLITDDTEVILNSRLVPLDELRTGDAVKITVNRANPKVAQHIRAARIVPNTRVRLGSLPRRVSSSYRPQFPGRELVQSDREAGLGVVVASSPGAGVLVLSVRPRSPANLAGIQIGDYIIAVAGETVSQAEQFVNLIRNREPGQSIEVVVWRDGERMDRQVTLVERGQATDATRSDARLDLIAVNAEALRRGAIILEDRQSIPSQGETPEQPQQGSQTQQALAAQQGAQPAPQDAQPEQQEPIPPAPEPERQDLLQEIQALQQQLRELQQQMDGLRQSEATNGTSI